jgi:mono/diheme cytochrome c family protein
MTYPLRSDLLVEVGEVKNIPATFGPGELYNFLDSLKVKAVEDKDNFKVWDPAKLPAEARDQIRDALAKRFGTPASPTIGASSSMKLTVTELQLDDDTLAKGSLLYRRHCLHCHGVSGDGHGPTAAWVNPPPRDYRRGWFKFLSVVSVGPSTRPFRSDLYRTLTEGIEGTSMPTFKAQPERDREALVSYVMHLSIRGSVEYNVMDKLLRAIKEMEAKDQASDSALAKLVKDTDIPNAVREGIDNELGYWAPGRQPIVPPPYPYKDISEDGGKEFRKSVEHGYELFIGKGICRECHIDFGRQAMYLYDKWGTLARPNNLTMGVYRGGRRPVDFYYRVAAGIDPSRMPAFNVKDLEKDENAIWDLVNFVRSLPYPAMLPDNIREKVYADRR